MEDERNGQREEMDAAAVRARHELEPNLDSWRAGDVIEWWNRWYLKAGHKRLGRVRVDISKKKASSRD